MDPLSTGLLDMKFLKLKYSMHTRVEYGTLHGILWVTSSAVGVMIIQQSFGVEPVQATWLETNTLPTYQVQVSKILFRAVHPIISRHQRVQLPRDHLQEEEQCVVKELFQVWVLLCLCHFQPLIQPHRQNHHNNLCWAQFPQEFIQEVLILRLLLIHLLLHLLHKCISKHNINSSIR